ncbi:MAG: hypothetical protein A2234_07440 [Elusimicrobia bacterium RIFOXYA2_FULL_58_8]|nr:MAG: hypothetical protein A2234_07440 [Elusimicrobia bacterium RIFOXYA2_FULL_58_8]
MGTSKKTIESLSKALALVPEVSFLPVKGEYCVYSRGRMFAMVCNDELFLKTSPETLCLFRDTRTRAYPGSTNTCKANAEWLEDAEKLGEVVLYTLASHPPPRAPGGARCSGTRPAAAGAGFDSFPLGKLLGAGALLTALYFFLPYGVLSAIGIHKGARAESFSVTGLHGEKMRLSECAGKPVFLYVWETNSQRAIDNLPMLETLYAEYQNSPVCFMPVTITADFNGAVRAFASTMALKYPVYNGAVHLPGQFRPLQSPMLYLIDHKGYIRYSYSPSGNDREEIAADLGGLLREVPPRDQGRAAW